MAAKKKSMFHAPKKTGKMRDIPTSMGMRVISIISLVLLIALTAFAVYAVIQKGGEMVALSPGYAMSAAFLFILLVVIAWVIALGFRLAIRLIPLEMWRLPLSIRDATIATSGRYLKYATLLIELETVLAFGYIMISLYRGGVPGDLPILIWVAAIVATIIFFGRYVKIAAER